MYCFTENDTIRIELDANDNPTIEDVVAGIANGDVDFYEVANEGCPIYLGNEYAQYEFTAYVNGELCEFAYGAIEHDELVLNGVVSLYAAPKFEMATTATERKAA